MTHPSTDAELRRHLVELLQGGHAHIRFADVVRDFPVARAGVRPPGLPHSAWELLEHLRIAQADILRFSLGPDYVELPWPDAYWPASPAPANDHAWQASVEAVNSDLARFLELLQEPHRSLWEPFPWGDGQTLLREALLIADHNAYHLGQLMLLRRLLS